MASDNNDIVYHYTSPEALISILKDKKIWATNYNFLNDSKELIQSLDLLSKNKADLNLDKAINFLKTADFNLAVLSLSSKGDLLSQWRSYCPSTGGYAIGFDREKLNEILKKRRFYKLKKCIYDYDEQIREIEKFIEINPPGHLTGQFEKYNINIYEFIKNVGLLIKHKGFKEENEWRAISEIMALDFLPEGVEWKVRDGIHSLIQYAEVYLGKDIPIKEIIIGPCRDKELAKNSVDRALRIFNYNEVNEINVKTIISDIPYRSK